MVFGRLSLVALILFLSAGSALACTGGLEWIAESGLYITDVTNDTPVIYPGMTVHYDFELFNKSDPAYGPEDTVEYSLARATLTHGKTVLFTKDIPYQKDRELAGFDYVFPETDAEYVLNILYLKNGEQIADATVPVLVGTGETRLAGPIVVGVLTAVLVFIIGARMLGFGKIVSARLS